MEERVYLQLTGSHPMGVGGRVREKLQRHFSTEQPEKCLSSILADKN